MAVMYCVPPQPLTLHLLLHGCEIVVPAMAVGQPHGTVTVLMARHSSTGQVGQYTCCVMVGQETLAAATL